jgi:hypothetical protein
MARPGDSHVEETRRDEFSLEVQTLAPARSLKFGYTPLVPIGDKRSDLGESYPTSQVRAGVVPELSRVVHASLVVVPGQNTSERLE